MWPPKRVWSHSPGTQQGLRFDKAWQIHPALKIWFHQGNDQENAEHAKGFSTRQFGQNLLQVKEWKVRNLVPNTSTSWVVIIPLQTEGNLSSPLHIFLGTDFQWRWVWSWCRTHLHPERKQTTVNTLLYTCLMLHSGHTTPHTGDGNYTNDYLTDSFFIIKGILKRHWTQSALSSCSVKTSKYSSWPDIFVMTLKSDDPGETKTNLERCGV